jgi:hypothetical protein
MRVLVCGSRDWGDQGRISEVLGNLPPVPHEVIHGAASRIVEGREKSADMLADEVARFYGYKVRTFPADWGRYGRRAGVIRNVEMLDQAPDLVIAFQVNGSRGTQHTITEARRRGIPVEVHRAES